MEKPACHLLALLHFSNIGPLLSLPLPPIAAILASNRAPPPPPPRNRPPFHPDTCFFPILYRPVPFPPPSPRTWYLYAVRRMHEDTGQDPYQVRMGTAIWYEYIHCFVSTKSKAYVGLQPAPDTNLFFAKRCHDGRLARLALLISSFIAPR